MPIPLSISPRSLVRTALVAAACGALTGPAARADEDNVFVLIDRNLGAQPITVAGLSEGEIVFRDEADVPRRLALDECLALVRVDGPPLSRSPGLLVLTDGQRLPGRLDAGAAPDPDTIAWIHHWLGPIQVSMDDLMAVTFRPGQPIPVSRQSDVVELSNGDRVEGFITRVGDPVAIEVDLDGDVRAIEIPLERVAALALITPARAPAGRRVWFNDGSVLDARGLAIGDDGYVRLGTAWTAPSEQPVQVRVPNIVAILFDPGAFVPLSGLDPVHVETRAPRYVVPAPRMLDEIVPLGLGAIEYRGPLVVRYALPAGCTRFAAAATIPPGARGWGDFEVVVRDEGRELFRRRLNARTPSVEINVPLEGSELTIELDQGANGPIQDRLRLTRAMLLVGE